jgi:ParB family chromosome partitioning protein
MKPSFEDKRSSNKALPEVRVGDEWMLERHLIYCGDTADDTFVNKLLPSNASLAIATLSSSWNHDYLVNEAHIVAVIAREGQIQDFFTRHRMPFRFEWVLDNMYIGIYSHKPVLKPEKPAAIEGIEGIVAYLMSLYTKPDNFVLAPFLGHGEVLIACERMGRTCFSGDRNPENVERAIDRWQKWTGQEARKENSTYA